MERSALDWVVVAVGLAPTLALGGVVGYELTQEADAALLLPGVDGGHKARVETLRVACALLGSLLAALGFLLGSGMGSRKAMLWFGSIAAMAMVAFHVLLNVSGGIVLAGLLLAISAAMGRTFGRQR